MIEVCNLFFFGTIWQDVIVFFETLKLNEKLILFSLVLNKIFVFCYSLLSQLSLGSRDGSSFLTIESGVMILSLSLGLASSSLKKETQAYIPLVLSKSSVGRSFIVQDAKIICFETTFPINLSELHYYRRTRLRSLLGSWPYSVQIFLALTPEHFWVWLFRIFS